MKLRAFFVVVAVLVGSALALGCGDDSVEIDGCGAHPCELDAGEGGS